MQDLDYGRLAVRTLKRMRRYHRKLRANTMHRAKMHELNKYIFKKQDKYFEVQQKAFSSKLFGALNSLNNRR